MMTADAIVFLIFGALFFEVSWQIGFSSDGPWL
jgi:hypothetical protein